MKKLLIIILAVLVVLALVKNKKSADTTPKDVNSTLEQTLQEQEDIGQEVQSFSISGFSEDGKNKWQVEGESADIFSEVVDMHTIEAKSYGEDVSITLTADEGTFFKNSKDIELRKNVIANTDEGTILKTNKLKWLATSERIVTDDYVYIEREDMNVAGTGAKAAPDMKKVWLNQDIKMTVNPSTKNFGMGINPVRSLDSEDDSKTSNGVNPTISEDEDSKKLEKGEPGPATIITCDGPLEVDYQNNISYFNKNVVIEDEEGKIYADKLIAYIDPKQKRIYKAIAKGNVKIMHQQNISYSDEAIYLPDEGKAILTGRPKVVIHSADKLLGDTKETNQNL